MRCFAGTSLTAVMRVTGAILVAAAPLYKNAKNIAF
jgi:hypothetical protein